MAAFQRPVQHVEVERRAGVRYTGVYVVTTSRPPLDAFADVRGEDVAGLCTTR
jgi:hypothetical protein